MNGLLLRFWEMIQVSYIYYYTYVFIEFIKKRSVYLINKANVIYCMRPASCNFFYVVRPPCPALFISTFLPHVAVTFKFSIALLKDIIINHLTF